MNILLVVLLVVVGVALMVVELFLIPGFGVAGVAGILTLIGSVTAAYYYLGAMAGHLTLASVLVLLAVSIYVFLRSRALDKMALKTDIRAKVDLLKDLNVKVGDTAITTSRLAPMGKVRVGEQEIEAKSNDAFIDENTPVEILAIDGNRLIVKSLKP